MELMQQQLNTLIQDNNPKNKEATATQNESGGNKETRKDKEGESSTSIPSLEDAQITQKVEQVIQKAKTGLRKEDECILEATSPFISRIMKTEIPTKFKVPQLDQYDGMGDPITHISSFRIKMMLQNINNGILCRVFPSTLTKITQR